jgi:hypothetical protein
VRVQCVDRWGNAVVAGGLPLRCWCVDAEEADLPVAVQVRSPPSLQVNSRTHENPEAYRLYFSTNACRF